MSNSEMDIAVVGLSGRFPGARNADEFWQKIRNGEELISFFSDEEVERPNPNDPGLVKACGVLADIDLLDAEFFNISPREAQLMDPQQRVFLECCWNAVENAGYDLDGYAGAVALYAGVSVNTYALSLLPTLHDPANLFQALIASDKDFLATRVSYKLNLTGESVTVQTACSTSLVAVHMACQSLLTGQCDMALAGGVTIVVPQKAGYVYQEGVINSPDGHCRAFDARAKGTVRGNGAGVVVLKMLSDALRDGDHVHAVIKGSAVNNDGRRKVGFTAPSVAGQADVIAKAQAMAGVEPETIGYVEAHGTGTPLGDPIEIEALTRVFREGTGGKQFCAIGSVKTNIGHLDSAAGIAGLIKTVQALKHGEIPPSLHFQTPNPEIDFENSPFYVSTSLHELKRGETPRRAGVSSFGIGGTNAHVVLEEAPALRSQESPRPLQILTLSARTPAALQQMSDDLADHLQNNPGLNFADAAYTRNVGRKVFPYRRAVVAGDANECAGQLRQSPRRQSSGEDKAEQPQVVMMFPGQGFQFAGAARALYEREAVFGGHVDHCAEYLRQHLGMDLRDLLHPPSHLAQEADEKLRQTRFTQPALFVLEYALAQLWASWGIRPRAMIGHSLGEYVAACLSGVISLEDALRLVATRGSLMQSLPEGRMVTVGLSEEDCRRFLKGNLSLAAVNGATNCVLSGPPSEVESLTQTLTEQRIVHRALRTSHAFHSGMVEPVLDEFSAAAAGIEHQPPGVPYVSGLTGRLIKAEEIDDPSYWSRQMRQTVRFAAGIDALREELPNPLFIEVGPGHTLATLAKRHLEGARDVLVAPSLGPDPGKDYSTMLETLGKLWAQGVAVDWAGYYRDERRRRVPLPTYPFERKRHWIEVQQKPAEKVLFEACALSAAGPPQATQGNGHAAKGDAPRDEVETIVAGIWKSLLGTEEVGIHDNFFELGGDSLIAAQIYARLKQAFPVDLSLEDLLTSQTIAELGPVIAEKLRREPAEPQYYCAFDLKIGDSDVAIKMTKEEFHERGIPEAAQNLQFL
jgi:phthiocerol/phenolphthiocerol synthesis type-I polyketide synthase E